MCLSVLVCASVCLIVCNALVEIWSWLLTTGLIHVLISPVLHRPVSVFAGAGDVVLCGLNLHCAMVK